MNIRLIILLLLVFLLAACAQNQTAPPQASPPPSSEPATQPAPGPTSASGVRVTLNVGSNAVSVFAPGDWSSNNTALVNDANRDVLMTAARTPGGLDGTTLQAYVSEMASVPGAEAEFYDSGDKNIVIIRTTGEESHLLTAHVGLPNGDLVYLAVVDFTDTTADLSAYEAALRQVAESAGVPAG